MSNRLKLNVKNVILGRYNFGDILARRDSTIFSGFSQLSKINNPDCKQEYVRKYTCHTQVGLHRSLDEIPLKRITLETPPIKNRFDEVHTGRNHIAGCGLLWESPIRFYYEKKCPQCPPPCPKIDKDCRQPPVPPCPPIAKTPVCPVKPKCYPLKPKPCTKYSPCTFKTIPLYNCRFMSGDPCQPKVPSQPSKPRYCKPKPDICNPEPKCGSPARCGMKPCKPTSPCGAQAGGDPCSNAKKTPKECYSTPGKQLAKGEGGGAIKKGPVCPPSDKPCGK